MRTSPVVVAVAIVVLSFACKTERKNKNDDIAACNAGGGRWVEGGCNDTGHCERSTGAAPDDDDWQWGDEGEEEGED